MDGASCVRGDHLKEIRRGIGYHIVAHLVLHCQSPVSSPLLSNVGHFSWSSVSGCDVEPRFTAHLAALLY
jgi:hypothetical protein